jgi:hypothetical protein
MIWAKTSIAAMPKSPAQKRASLSDGSAVEPPRPGSQMRPDRVPGTQGGERKKSSPAPLCDSTTSLQLDQTGQRVERTRNKLRVAGHSCLCFGWLLGAIVAVIIGGGKDVENPTFFLTTVGVAIGGDILLLVGLIVGRRTSDWWHPRLRETAPTGRSREGLSVESFQTGRISRRGRRDAKRRHRMAKRVRRQIRKAQIFHRRQDGGGTLLTEPILVLHGPRRGKFVIFDQEGNPLGSAVRVRDTTAESPGRTWISDVRDSQGQSVLAIRLAARRRWLKCAPTKTGTYAVCSHDGSEIANIEQSTKHASRTVTAGRTDTIARLDGGHAMTISDAGGRQVAQITSNAEEWYVLNYTAAVDEPLRGVVLAASIVWDDERPESTS